MEHSNPSSIFPIEVQSAIQSHNGPITRNIKLHGPFSTVLGPNGSGKTHLLRGLKASLYSAAGGKKIRFLSAGRMGLTEQYRSNYDGHRGDTPNYDAATYGNKRDVYRRHEVEILQGDLQTLSQRVDILVKVQERLRKLFRRDLILEWDAGELKVLFNRSDENSVPYSSGREASGLMQLVGLLSALYDDEVGVLLIDEPEVSLHPQLQSFLLQEIHSVAGQPSAGNNKKIVLIATHSTEMVRLRAVDDLPHFIFCNDLRFDPVQIQPDAPELKNKKIINLVASMGQLHRLSLFSTRPLLVEGASDSIICQALARKLLLFPEAAGSQFLPVEGKDKLPVVAKLLRLMGKAPTALVDLDGFADGPTLIQDYLSATPELSKSEAGKIGASSGSELASKTHDQLCDISVTKWTTIEPLATTHTYWNLKCDDENLRKRRALLGTLFCNTDEVLEALKEGSEFVNLKSRITALFDLAEKCGLFFCRKGTIESYYYNPVSVADFDKPQAATDEAEQINENTIESVLGNYADVLRCINFASRVEKIDEAMALQDILLSIAAPSMGRLANDESDSDLNAFARQTIGDRAALFHIEKKNGKLEIKLHSKILDAADCFPITIEKEENVVNAISKALKLSKN